MTDTLRARAVELGEFRRCGNCGDYGFTFEHRCAPLFQCRIETIGRRPWDEGDDWRETHAIDPEEAAKKFCDHYDANGDYPIITAGAAVILVRKPTAETALDDEPTYKTWRVEVDAEMTRAYYAYGSATEVADG
jgi:hypothetical protein